MTGQPPLLAALLEGKGMHRYGTFRAAYEKAARSVDRDLGGSAPSRAQFHRWLTADLRGLPYTDHCRVLEHMLPGYSAAQLFQPCPASGIPVPVRGAADTRMSPVLDNGHAPPSTLALADVTAVFASRSEFAAKVEPCALFEGASRIRAVGLSWKSICFNKLLILVHVWNISHAVGVFIRRGIHAGPQRDRAPEAAAGRR